MLPVSRKTINRRMEELGLHDSYERHSNPTDTELDNKVAEVFRILPNCGIRRMRGFLECQGFRIQRERVQNSSWPNPPLSTVEYSCSA